MSENTIIMNAVITKEHKRDRTTLESSIVYVKCPITNIVDEEFFLKHKIFNLNFKCNTWNAVKRYVNKLTITALQPLFPDDTLKFSAKAGCQCGCSPGYKLTHSKVRVGKDIWATVTYNDDILNQVRDELAHFETKLQKEIAEHNE